MMFTSRDVGGVASVAQCGRTSESSKYVEANNNSQLRSKWRFNLKRDVDSG